MKQIKSMKKSMFISTILMVVLLIVALSTATFAWFSANNTVTATQTTMTAASSSSANIAIGWGANPVGSTISFKNVNMLQPAIPNIQPQSVAGTSSALYISTNITPTGATVPFAAMPYAGADKVEIVDIRLGETIKVDTNANVVTALVGGGATVGNTAIENDTAIAPFARIYKTLNFDAAKYVGIPGELAAGSFTTISYNSATYDFLVISTSETGTSFITPTEAQASPYSLDAGQAVIGNRLYHRNAIKDTFRVYAKGQVPNAGQFIAGGVSVSGITGKDYLTFLTAAGTLDTKVEIGSSGTYNYYVNLDTAKATPYKSASAKDGDVMYCVQKAGEPVARTTVAAFIGALQTSAIDTENRFRSNGGTAGSSALQDLNSTANNFYIKNTGAISSNAAKISLNATITGVDGVATDDIRIAVFAKTSGDAQFYYLDTLASGGGTTCFGSIIAGAHSSKENLGNYTAKTGLDGFTQIAPQAQIEMQFVVWYEGTMLGTTGGGKAVNVTFTFSAA